jgi:hypothetical protein
MDFENEVTEFKLDLNILAVPITPDLKMKSAVTQVNAPTVSELIFNTGSADLDRDLPKMFYELQLKEQKAFESKGGQGELKNLFVQILSRTQGLTDHKVLPAEAVKLMFRLGTTISLDHTLQKDAKFTKEELAIKAQTSMLDAGMDSAWNMLADLDKKVAANNKGTNPTAPELDTSDVMGDIMGDFDLGLDDIPSDPEDDFFRGMN